MLDKMSARCEALSVNSGPKNYIDGACVLADADGDMIFSSFDTRDLDKSQPDMKCGTHIITGGTGKYKGITGSEPFACNGLPALAGAGGYTAMDIPHNTSGRSRNSVSLPGEDQASPTPEGWHGATCQPFLVLGSSVAENSLRIRLVGGQPRTNRQFREPWRGRAVSKRVSEGCRHPLQHNKKFISIRSAATPLTSARCGAGRRRSPAVETAILAVPQLPHRSAN